MVDFRCWACKPICATAVAVLFLSSGLRYAVIFTVAAMGNATASPEQQEPLPVTQIASGVFVFEGQYKLVAPANRGEISNVAFVVGEEAVAVIDTGSTLRQGQRLKAAIRKHTDKPIRYAINTHMHPDHVLGNAAFPEAEIIGHIKLKPALIARGDFYLERGIDALGAEAMAGTDIVLPQVEVSGTLTLDLGGRQIELRAHPTAHTDNDLTVFDVKTRTLFLGDLLFVRHVPSLDGSLKGWLAVMADLEATSAERAVPGHGPPSVPWPAALAPQRRYLERLRNEVREKIAAGVRLGDAARTVGIAEQDAWALFEEYNARNVSTAYAELEWE
jgi:quinoprotein relay system zinc metallohydrolase 2